MRTHHARPIYALRAGHPPNGLTAWRGVRSSRSRALAWRPSPDPPRCGPGRPSASRRRNSAIEQSLGGIAFLYVLGHSNLIYFFFRRRNTVANPPGVLIGSVLGFRMDYFGLFCRVHYGHMGKQSLFFVSVEIVETHKKIHTIFERCSQILLRFVSKIRSSQISPP
jgi:hypothetical protein